MLGSVAELLFCWHHWLGKHNSDIWNPGCLMWAILIERNWRSFEDTEKSLVRLLDFDWSQC